MIKHSFASYRKIERSLRAYNVLPFELDPKEAVDIGVKTIHFSPEMSIAEVRDYVEIYKIDVALSWEENGRVSRLSRSAFISDYVKIK